MVGFSRNFFSSCEVSHCSLLLTLAVSYHWDFQQIHVNNVYLNEEVYMERTRGFKSSGRSLVCKHNKALYSHKQGLRAWFKWLTFSLLSFGFKASCFDSSLLMLHGSKLCLFVLIYFDDIIVN